MRKNTQERDELVRQRDELIEALSDILSIVSEFIDEESDARTYRLEAARAAIAKATGAL